MSKCKQNIRMIQNTPTPKKIPQNELSLKLDFLTFFWSPKSSIHEKILNFIILLKL